MSLVISPLSAQALKSPAFLAFLQRFDDNFATNRSLNHAPWTYTELAHFHYHGITHKQQYLAVMVTSVHASNEHLNFLYVDTDWRSQGLGEQLIAFWQQQAQRPLLTIHVKAELERTQAFYHKMGFALTRVPTQDPVLQPWVTQALQFNPLCYDGVVLMWQTRAHNLDKNH